MAKQATECDVCGGKYDGTPSGKLRHNGTGKHQAANASAPKNGKVVQVTGTATVPKTVGSAGSKTVNAAIAEVTKLLRRRKYSHQWREKYAPERADSYYTEKVKPLEDRLAELQGK